MKTVPAKEKIKSIEELEKIVEEARKKGKTIVTTNGCFDILHIGHVRYLQDAAKLGDLMIVGINGDASVRKLKGKNRPVVPEGERAEVVASLGCVDYVFIFNEDDPVVFAGRLKPHFHAKGGDYSEKKMIEREIVEKHGGKIIILKEEKGYSTSSTIKKINERGDKNDA